MRPRRAAHTADVVIVGGGSAGSVLANRLSADPSCRVVVLEAGRSDYPWDLFIQMPGALTFPSGNPLYDWRYQSEPEPHLHDRRIAHARGKVLGGSSSINGMIFQRGNPMDYDRWGALPGLEEWDWAHCLPYFKRLENALAADRDDPYRGHSGPLELERGPATNPLFGAFFEAAQQAGYPLTDDVNGFQQEGFAPFDRNVRQGRRLSASRAYLRPVSDRPNLTVVTLANASRITFDGTRATGVDYLRAGRAEHVAADEVVLCGGAFGSPHLLQLSGVGPADQLAAVGVDVVHDLPGVGENLQDHLEVYVQHGCHQAVTLQPELNRLRMPLTGMKWMLGRTGAAASNHFEGGGFVRSNDQVEWPNLMFHFLPIAVRYDGQAAGVRHGYQVHIGPMYADTIGSLRLRSADPLVRPELRFNYLSTEKDRREWVEAVAVARDILAQPAMRPFDAGELSPGPDVRTDAQVLDWVGREAETALHPCGTAKLGRHPTRWPSSTPTRCACTACLGCGWSMRRCSPSSPTPTLCTHDDGGREGRRSDQRRRAARAAAPAGLPGHRPGPGFSQPCRDRRPAGRALMTTVQVPAPLATVREIRCPADGTLVRRSRSTARPTSTPRSRALRPRGGQGRGPTSPSASAADCWPGSLTCSTATRRPTPARSRSTPASGWWSPGSTWPTSPPASATTPRWPGPDTGRLVDAGSVDVLSRIEHAPVGVCAPDHAPGTTRCCRRPGRWRRRCSPATASCSSPASSRPAPR